MTISQIFGPVQPAYLVLTSFMASQGEFLWANLPPLALYVFSSSPSTHNKIMTKITAKPKLFGPVLENQGFTPISICL
jgi:hypothetical protein